MAPIPWQSQQRQKDVTPQWAYPWDSRPYIKVVDGYPREFFTIGHLANALMRSSMTIRGWEAQGIFPKPSFIVGGADRHGRRRLYTRKQIEGVARIAHEEGILDNRRRFIKQTRFSERCFELFKTRELPPPITSVPQPSPSDQYTHTPPKDKP